MEKFKQNIINIYGNSGKIWLANLPGIIKDITERYNLQQLKQLNDLTYNYLMVGQQNIPGGTVNIILKLSLDKQAIRREIAALRVFAQQNVVHVIAADENMILLRKIEPGQSLSLNSSSIRIACQLMQSLHSTQSDYEYDFPHIQDSLKILEQNWPTMPLAYLTKARQLSKHFGYLFAANQPKILLHGDLHYGNILAHKNEWVAIDPKGIIGHPINEIWAFVMDIENDTMYIAEFFKFDLALVRSWYFIHIILAACQTINDNNDPHIFLQLAHKAFKLLD